MATLRELRKRLRSVKSTGALAGAMKTVSTAKYSRLSSALQAGEEYTRCCETLVSLLGGLDIDCDSLHGAPALYVLFSGNRGLCGGYNSELFVFFSDLRKTLPDSCVYAACGRTAREYCREKKINLSYEFEVPDVPTFADAQRVSEYFRCLYSEGAVSEIIFVYQKFENMLKQTPAASVFLSAETQPDICEGDVIYIPDRATVAESALPLCFDEKVYSHLLKCASGAQAATLMAMRAAYDNAGATSAALETAINRRRQTEVTAGVIETSSDFYK
ncbi:MAG: F0F1 ATP synthase subunit gamma [Clostridia bacterium]|nr:F0F1 ATP synthase subunit gamma [Clostridia bacterium]